MIHWQHAPVAIAPTTDGWIATGFLAGARAPTDDADEVIYTGVLPAAAVGNHARRRDQREVQWYAGCKRPGVAYLEKMPDPVILRPPEHLAVTGFRDPGVWKEGKEWLLTLGSGIKGKGGAVLLYESREYRAVGLTGTG